MKSPKTARRTRFTPKKRTEPTQIVAGRRLSQKRSQIRVDALLNAAEQLLQRKAPGEIGVYDIARAAGIPPASAYHFFPTKESAMLALAERHLHKLHAALLSRIDVSTIERWPDYMRAHYDVIVHFFNDSLSARKLLIGAVMGSEIKNLDLAGIDQYTATLYVAMNEVFVMPYVVNPNLKFTVLIGIYDGIWQASYAKFGLITEEFAREGFAAGLAYLETFLPKTIPLREPTSRS